jgi:hypothetical protein
MAAAPLEQTFWETFCDLIGLEPELHGDEQSSTATKARVAAIIATEKFHGVSPMVARHNIMPLHVP